MLIDTITQFYSVIEAGGWVTYPLLLTSGLLSYMIGIRWMYLRRGDKRAVASIFRSLPSQEKQFHGVIASAILAAREACNCQETLNYHQMSQQISLSLFDYRQGLSQYKKTIQTIVAITPLLGLLGTVIGMIETFDSLGDMSLFAQQSGGGIAGGISQALITTQLGLIIAIPGLFFERFLSRKEDLLRHDLDTIQELACRNKEGTI